MLPFPPLFQRSSDPLVSILMPSRGKPAEMCATMSSFVDLAVEKKAIQFLLRIDDDDPASFDAARVWGEEHPDVEVIAAIGPRGNGYVDMHLWIEELSQYATGAWLCLSDDDFEMRTIGWDVYLNNVRPNPMMPWSLDVAVVASQENNVFMCMRRRTWEILGHGPTDFVVDAWIFRTMDLLGAVTRIPVNIQHDPNHNRNDLMNMVYKKGRHYAAKTYLRRAEDALKLAKHMERMEQNVVWTNEPEKRGWYIWDDPIFMPRAVFLDGKEGSRWAIRYDPPCEEHSHEITGTGLIVRPGKEPEYEGRWHLLREEV